MGWLPVSIKMHSIFSELEALGFGFVEIGTVTPKPQAGNDKPRLFRLPKDKALINRMGFNNDGVQVVAQRLKEWREKQRTQRGANSPSTIDNSPLIIGGNIGKNKVTLTKTPGKITRSASAPCSIVLIILW